MKKLALLSLFFIILTANTLYSAGTSGCGSVWDNATILDSDKTFYCLDIKSGANVDFNGYTVTVYTGVHMYAGYININGGTFEIGVATGEDRNLTQEGGTIELDNGSIIIHGSDNITGSSYMNMNDENDYVLVEGNFYMKSNQNQNTHLTAGILEVKGDFYQIKGNSDNFRTSGSHKVILSGNNPQSVSFDSPSKGDSHFNTLEINNPNPINFNTTISVLNNIINVSNTEFNELTIKDTKWTLDHDTTINGDLTVDSSYTNYTLLDLNGYKLTVKGDLNLKGYYASYSTIKLSGGELIIDNSTGGGNLNQSGGTLDIDNGSLTVYGNDNITGYSYFEMDNISDNVVVYNDFIMASNKSHSGKLTEGTLEIKGDFYQKKGNSENFQTSGNHKVILSGDSAQEVSFDSPSKNNSHFNTLEIDNPNSIDFNTPICVLNNIIKTFNTEFNELTLKDSKWTLDHDTTINGDLTVDSSYTNYTLLDLNGYKLTVKGDLNLKGYYASYSTIKLSGGELIIDNSTGGGNLNQSGGTLDIDNGVLTVKGNDNITGNSYFEMDNISDNVVVYNDFIMNSNKSHSGKLTEGILEVKGDFYQKKGNSENFQTSGNHKVILSGDSAQEVSFDSPSKYYSHFNTLEIDTPNSINFNTPICVLNNIIKTFNTEFNELTLKDSKWTLAHDTTINGDLTVDSSYTNYTLLDLNGYKLTVKGDLNLKGYYASYSTIKLSGGELIIDNSTGGGNLNQSGGTLDIDNGVLTVKGNDNITGNSYFVMDNVSDNVTVYDDFIMNSNKSHSGKLTEGTLEIKGNFYQKKGNSGNFNASGNHKVILSGDSAQEVSFDSPSKYYSHFNTLEIQNNSVKFLSSISVKNSISTSQNTTINDNLTLKDTSWTFDSDTTINGDLTFNGNTLDLNGYTLTINGNLNQTFGIIDINNGTLLVKGNDNITGNSYLVMDNLSDNVTVYGDFIMNSNLSHFNKLTAGILEVKGDFYQKNGNNNNFNTSENHKVILSGDSLQEVSFDSPAKNDSHFNILEIQNSSVKFLTSISVKNSITTSPATTTSINDNLTLKDTTWTLDNDATINGDLTFNGNTLDLNGYTLTIKGNLYQTSGTIDIDNGTLIVKGNDNITGNSYLIMDDVNDNVTVYGDFIMNSDHDHTGKLSNGLLVLKGDFYQIGKNWPKGYNFKTSGNHTVVFAGTDNQTVSFETLEKNQSHFTNLTIKNSTSVNFLPYLLYTGDFNNSSSIDFTELTVKDTTWTLENNRVVYDNLTLTGSTLDLNGKTLTVKGDLYVKNSSKIKLSGGHLIIENSSVGNGDLLQSSGTIDIDNGTLIVKGNDNITGNSYLIMDDVNDNVTVNGDFIMNSDHDHTGKLSNGVLVLKGDFYQIGKNWPKGYNFKTSDNHTVVFAGDTNQKVSFDFPDINHSHFVRLIIKNSNISFITPAMTKNLFNVSCNNFSSSFDNLTVGSIVEFICNKNLTLSDNKTIYGDFILKGGTINLNGYVLKITGKFTQLGGVVKFNNGSLIVEGDYVLVENGTLIMDNDKDYLEVRNNFLINNSLPNLNISKGYINLKGDLNIESVTKFGDNNTIIFNGNNTVYFSVKPSLIANPDDPSAKLGKVIIKNNDIDYLDTIPIKTYSVTDVSCGVEDYVNNDNLTYLKHFKTKNKVIICKDKNITFNDNITVQSHLIFDNSTLDLNLHQLKIAGYLKLLNSNLNIDGGELAVATFNNFINVSSTSVSTSGDVPTTLDLTQDNSTLNINNGFLYVFGNYVIKGNSKLIMTNENDNVTITGNLIMKSDISHKNYLSNGKMNIEGNIYQLKGNPENLYTTGNNRIILDGAGEQNIYFESPSTHFQFLDIENPEVTISSKDNSSLQVSNLRVFDPSILNSLNISAENITTTDNNTVTSYTLNLKKGWNLSSIPVSNEITSLNNKFKDNITFIWKWLNKAWEVWSPDNSTMESIINQYGLENLTEILPGEGFWVLTNSETSIIFYGEPYGNGVLFPPTPNQWFLYGCGNNTTVDSIEEFAEQTGNNIETVWKWDNLNNQWKVWSPDKFISKLLTEYNLPSFSQIFRGEGFWVYFTELNGN